MPPNESYTSTINYTYDGGDRLRSAVDSANGTITDDYDDLDRLTLETTPQGTVSYTCDNADRRATMTASGQGQVVYGFDNADRLTSVTQGASSAGIGYDDADRRTSVTLPDAISEQYAYDSASELSSITYKLGGSTLGDLDYGYDFAGKRNAVWGSYARTGLPTAVTSATTYNNANQLTKWANTATSNDLNGSLTNDSLGTTYTWNNRGQLASTSKTGTSVSYTYDAFGRRKSETVNGTTTSFLYDGPNVVQEQSGSNANLLTGVSPDETFSRTIGTDQKSFLTDVVGSTVALADTSGSVATSYTYEAFGKPSSSGATSTNTFQYTGRESDANNLLEFRTRYDSPTLQRFLSEDPLGFVGGDPNLYLYVSDSPLNLVDPTGLCGHSLGGLLGALLGRCGSSPFVSIAKFIWNHPITIGLCGNISVSGAFLNGHINGCLMVSTRGGVGATGTAGGGFSTTPIPQGSATVGVQTSNASCINDLAGEFNTLGGSVGYGVDAAADVSVGSGAVTGKPVTVTQGSVGVGVRNEIHGGKNWTTTASVGFGCN